MPAFMEVMDQRVAWREITRLKVQAAGALRTASNAFTEKTRIEHLEHAIEPSVKALEIHDKCPNLFWPREAAFRRFMEEAHRRLGNDTAADEAKKRAEEVEEQIKERLEAGDNLGSL
ncbi:hypothetical protein NLG97_g2022 [Lecanicillium saksenae]|uniref:Uncharacterized protein n=1 Tax=Lecanicillium saksenae TaxID=468837 RepID=A0ACC1R2A6_9HYPO|nr:hypothetical protein NLG97_g2022 [Lecanicillium saksenae]